MKLDMEISFKRAGSLALSLLISTGAFSILADNGVKIKHLGTNNTLVRVTDPAKFIILPVQESNDEATVNVIVDGKLEKSINVRLAKSKVDYTVPLNIEKYAGKDVVLNVITAQKQQS